MSVPQLITGGLVGGATVWVADLVQPVLVVRMRVYSPGSVTVNVSLLLKVVPLGDNQAKENVVPGVTEPILAVSKAIGLMQFKVPNAPICTLGAGEA